MERLETGTQVGRYVIDHQILVGRLLTLYIGRDPVLDRTVSIQQIHLTGSLEDDAIRHSVRQNDQTMRPLLVQHAQWWIQPLELIDSESHLLLVVEALPALTLEQEIRDQAQPMPPRTALGILAFICRALEPLHQANLAHLDLEPANMYRTAESTLKLANPGLARAIDWQYALRPDTVTYMAPEILQGETPDARADVYAIGMLGYRLLAGQKLFDEAFKVVTRDQQNQPLRWMKWHTNARAEVPTIHELVAGVDPAVGELIERLMQKSVNARPRDAGEVLEMLRRAATALDPRHQQAKSLTAATVPGGQLPGQSDTGSQTAALPAPSRLPMVLAVLCLVWVLVGAGIVGSVYYEKRHADAQRAAEAQGLLDDARSAFADAEFELAGRLYARLASQYADMADMVQTGNMGVIWSQAETHLQAQQYVEARRGFMVLVREGFVHRADLADRIMEIEQRNAFDRGMHQVRQLLERNDYSQARLALNAWDELTVDNQERQQIAALRQVVVERSADRGVRALVEDANDLWNRQQRAMAISSLEEGLIRFPGNEALSGLLEQMRLQERYDNLVLQGRAAQQTGELDRAIQQFTAAGQLESGETALREQHASLATWISEARIARSMRQAERSLSEGRADQAERHLREVLAIEENHAQARSMLGNLAAAGRRINHLRDGDQAMGQGNFAVAVEQYELAGRIEQDETLAGKLRDARFELTMQRYQAAMADARFPEAAGELEQARQLKPDDPRLRNAVSNLTGLQQYNQYYTRGVNALETGDFRSARIALMQAREIARASNGLIDPAITTQHLDLVEYRHLFHQAVNAYDRGDFRTALASVQSAMQKRRTPEAEALLDKLHPYLTGLVVEREEQPEPEPDDDSN